MSQSPLDPTPQLQEAEQTEALLGRDGGMPSPLSRGLFLALVLFASIGTGYFVWGNPSPDRLSPEDRDLLVKAAAALPFTPQRIDAANYEELAQAVGTLDLPPAEAAKVIAEAKAGDIQLAWITLEDFIDEDGDIVEMTTGALTRTVSIAHTPQTIAVPIVPGDFFRVTGILDGDRRQRSLDRLG